LFLGVRDMKLQLLALLSESLLSMASPAPASARPPAGMVVRADLYLNSMSYDPTRDPKADLAAGVVSAQASGKRILLDVGGEWCIWCHILDDYLARNNDVGDAFAASFVIVKITWEPKKRNEEFLSAYPDTDGYPHFYVLDSYGKFLASQKTSPLERGESYNKDRMLAFAARWKAS